MRQIDPSTTDRGAGPAATGATQPHRAHGFLAPHAVDIQQLRRRAVHGMLSRWHGGNPASPEMLPGHAVHRIVVLRPNHRLGNTLLLTPLLSEVERLYPGAEVDILTAGMAATEVFAAHDGVRNLWILPNRIARHPLQAWRTFRRMRRRHYDLAIDPCVGSHSGRLMLRFSSATHKLAFARHGFASGLTCGVAVPARIEHMGQLPVYLLRKASRGEFDGAPCPGLDVRLSRQEKHKGRERLRHLLSGLPKTATPIIALFGDATGQKAFPADWWQAVVAELQQLLPQARFLEILPASGLSRFADAHPTYYSTSIRRMASVMAATDLVISADCGVMHLATASGVATIGIFRTTRPVQYGPYGANNLALSAGDRPATAIAQDVNRFWCAGRNNAAFPSSLPAGGSPSAAPE